MRCLVEIEVTVHPDFRKGQEEDERRKKVEDGTESVTFLDKEDATPAPLTAVAGPGKLGCVKIFLENVVYVDEQDVFGQTPLHAAANAERTDVLDYLLAQGADPNKHSMPPPLVLLFWTVVLADRTII